MLISEGRIAELAQEVGIRIDPRFGEIYTGNTILTAFARAIEREIKPKWLPIETAPKDGAAILLSHAKGVWIGKYKPVYESGFAPVNPWFSLMLNHDHMADKSGEPTHWMPLPAAQSNLEIEEPK